MYSITSNTYMIAPSSQQIVDITRHVHLRRALPQEQQDLLSRNERLGRTTAGRHVELTPREKQ